jgi:hypothetical protein
MISSLMVAMAVEVEQVIMILDDKNVEELLMMLLLDKLICNSIANYKNYVFIYVSF